MANFLNAHLLTRVTEAVKFRSSEVVRTALEKLIKGLRQASLTRTYDDSDPSANRLVLLLRQLYV